MVIAYPLPDGAIDTTDGSPRSTVHSDTSGSVDAPAGVAAAALVVTDALAAAVSVAAGVTAAVGVAIAAAVVGAAVGLDAAAVFSTEDDDAAVPPQAATAKARPEIAMIFFIWELPAQVLR
jgi:hypothetical protein